MLRTEEEAKECWCPLTNDKGPCIASACMAWRWEMAGIGLRTDKGYCGLC